MSRSPWNLCPASDCMSEIRVIITQCFPGVWTRIGGVRMSDHGNGGGRRRKRMLSAQEKYQIWLQLLTGEVSQRRMSRTSWNFATAVPV